MQPARAARHKPGECRVGHEGDETMSTTRDGVRIDSAMGEGEVQIALRAAKRSRVLHVECNISAADRAVRVARTGRKLVALPIYTGGPS